MQSQTVTLWDDDTMPIEKLDAALKISAKAHRHIAGKKAGGKFNHRTVIKVDAGTVHVLQVFKKIGDRVVRVKLRLILKRPGEPDAAFDVNECWDETEPVYSVSGVADNRAWEAVTTIADILEIATLNPAMIRDCIIETSN